MTPAALAVCLAFAAFACATLAGAMVVVATDRVTRTAWWTRLGPRTRASLVAGARVAPLTFSLAFALLVQLAFWVFEPAHDGEHTGAPLLLLAAAGVGIVALAAARTWQAWWATRTLIRAWRASGAAPADVPGWPGPAWAVETTFPVVAVAGVRTAELFVSSGVLGACSPDELEVIVAHERAHLAGRDNMTRMLFLATPVTGPAAKRLEEQWIATAEEVADLRARDAGDGVTLARALTKVARLAVNASTPPLMASALIGGDSLERRVRRLLAPATDPGRRVRGLALLSALPAVALGVFALPLVYEAAEFLVRLGR